MSKSFLTRGDEAKNAIIVLNAASEMDSPAHVPRYGAASNYNEWIASVSWKQGTQWNSTKRCEMADNQYEALLNLWHEYAEAFNGLPYHIKEEFFKRLYSSGHN